MSRAMSGYTIQVKAWRILPLDDPAVKACLHGDLEAIRKLLADRIVSPRDRDLGNFTLLEVRVLYRPIESSLPRHRMRR